MQRGNEKVPTGRQMTEAEQKRQQARDEHPNAWIPVTAGDRLEGVVQEVTRAWSDARNRGTGDGFYPLIQVETSEGVLAFHAFSTVSYNRVMELQPLPGERIVVAYQGEGKAKPGQNPPKLFHVSLPERDPRAAAQATYGLMGTARAVTAVTQAQGGREESEPEQEEFGF